MKSDTKLAIEWRRSKVLELYSQGNNQSEISRILQISIATINRDIFYLRRESKQNIQRYIDEKLPEEYSKCLVGLDLLLKESWNISQEPDIERREKIQALSLAKDVYSTKLDLLTNCTVVDDVIRFINNHKQKRKEEVEEDDKEEVGRQQKQIEKQKFSN